MSALEASDHAASRAVGITRTAPSAPWIFHPVHAEFSGHTPRLPERRKMLSAERRSGSWCTLQERKRIRQAKSGTAFYKDSKKKKTQGEQQGKRVGGAQARGGAGAYVRTGSPQTPTHTLSSSPVSSDPCHHSGLRLSVWRAFKYTRVTPVPLTNTDSRTHHLVLVSLAALLGLVTGRRVTTANTTDETSISRS